MRRMPLFPFTTFSQKVFKSLPIGVTKPIPVTTTRRLLIGSAERSYFALFFWTPEKLSVSRAHTDHYRIRAARECLTDVASLAHTAIRNDWHIFAALLKIVIAGGRAIDRSRY